MAKEKKGAKFGRHARNPSSKLYPMRHDRNKRLTRERHARRMGLTTAQIAAACQVPTFPQQRVERPKESVVFQHQVHGTRGQLVHMLIVDGITLDVSLRETDIRAVTKMVTPGLPYRHVRVNPLTGEQVRVEQRA